jgi:hypothetical protein
MYALRRLVFALVFLLSSLPARNDTSHHSYSHHSYYHHQSYTILNNNSRTLIVLSY